MPGVDIGAGAGTSGGLRCGPGRARPPEGPIPPQYYCRIEGTAPGSQDGFPGGSPDGIILEPQECPAMKHRIQRAWQLVLSVSPLAAIALVEAAMKRW